MPKPIPDRESLNIKKSFTKHYRDMLGNDYEAFMDYSLSFLRRSIRVNTLKIPVQRLLKRLEIWHPEPIPWCKQGFWIQHEKGRRDIGNTREHALGYIYVQEAASMIPPLVLSPQPGEVILDLCASPGSKTTQIAQYMHNKGLLVANDYRGDRMRPLGINVQRMGITNTLLTNMLGHWFQNKGIMFDRILIDAPCSGTGAIRKSLKTLRIWNPHTIRRLAAVQTQLILTGYDMLRPGGTLVYSTCSVEPWENEAVVTSLLEKRDAVIEKVELDNLITSETFQSFQSSQYPSEVKKCLRIWPQDNDTQGFFVAKARRPLD